MTPERGLVPLHSRSSAGTVRAAVIHPTLLRAILPCSVALAACSTPSATSPTDGAPAAIESAKAAASAAPPVASAAPVASVSAPLPVPSAEPASSAAALPSAIPSAEPAASASVDPAAPLPSVKVTNIGMHIGGGPNDAPTKEPIKRSVEPHFDEFRRCFALVADQKKGGDFGVDLKIDKAGGKAQVSHPRTALKGKEFETCVVDVFKAIDFKKPRKGNTVVSYSLRFTP